MIFETVISWLIDQYGKDITNKAFGEAKQIWEQFNWQQAEADYRQRVTQLYGTVRILGKSEPTLLEDVFTDVFILDKPRAFQRFDIEAIEKDPDLIENGDRISGLRVIANSKNKKLFILGKPGAGKTTFLKHVALRAVQSKSNDVPLPIFVSLKEWADSRLSLLGFISKQFEICAFPKPQAFINTVLHLGKAILLFDGLDEIGQEDDQREKAITDLNDFSEQYLKNRILITCRNAATTYRFEQFTYLEVVDFDDKQRDNFVRKWFQDDLVKQKRFLEDIKKKEHRGLRELARVPLLLTMLCLAFEETLHFPKRHVEIYEEALDALLKKWDASRNIERGEVYHKLSLGRKRQMFARIAAQTFDQGEIFIRQERLESQLVDYLEKLPPTDIADELDGETVLEAIEAQHGILIKRAWRVYSFAHLTFQEYFTAKYIADNTEKGTTKRLLNQHLADDHWRVVFELTASLLDEADHFFALFQEALAALIEEDETLVKLLSWAESKSRGEVPYKSSATRAVYLFLALALDFHIDLLLINTLQIGLRFSLLNKPNEFPQSIMKFHNYFGEVLNHYQYVGLSDLQAALSNLTLPTETDNRATWIQFAAELRSIMIAHRDIGHAWNLSEEQLQTLITYLKGNELLVDCLALAYVTDRVAIEDGLLPPERTA